MLKSDQHYEVRLKQHTQGFPGGSDGKESACSAGDPGSIPGWGRSPGDGNGNPLQWIRTPWTEEPGRLQSMGLQRVRHQTQLSSSHTHTHTHTHAHCSDLSASKRSAPHPPCLIISQFVKYLIVSCILSNAVSQSLIYNSKVQRAAKWEVYMAVKYKAT